MELALIIFLITIFFIGAIMFYRELNNAEEIDSDKDFYGDDRE